MKNIKLIGLDEFLRDYPGMAIRPMSAESLRLKGNFAFTADHFAHGQVTDTFELQIEIPAAFPKRIPTVIETGGRIPREPDFHVDSGGSLCLGSHLRLSLHLREQPTLPGYAARCIVPFLYAMSLKLRNGGPFVFGELAHFSSGLLTDYAELFALPTTEQARYALSLLTLKKRAANKRPCPCGCGLRLGRCKYRDRLARYRKVASRRWFHRQLQLTAQ